MGIRLICLFVVGVFTVANASQLRVPTEYPTIREAINASGEGDTILVAAGTYTENIDFLGKAIAVLGAGRDSTTLQPLDSSLQVVVITNVSAGGAELSGFTIRGGRQVHTLLIDNNQGVTTIRENAFRENLLDEPGSASAYVIRALSKCRISRNIMTDNGGMACINCYDTSWVYNNTIAFNTGGIYSVVKRSFAINNVVAYNSDYGITGDFATMDYNCTWMNGFANYPGPHGIYSPPMFVDTSSRDLHPMGTSPCVDAGYPGALFYDANGTRCDLGALEALVSYPIVSDFDFGPSPSDTNIVSDRIPLFRWSYNDTLATTQVVREIEIGVDQDWATAEVWASGPVISPDTILMYPGPPLDPHAAYYLRIRVSDGARWGDWKQYWFKMMATGTIMVPARFPTIQQAIDYAIDGDTVLVLPGTYRENIDYLSKKLTIKSRDGAAVTTIRSAGDYRPVVGISDCPDSGASLLGFTVLGSPTSGIFVSQSDFLVEHCIVRNNGNSGIYCSRSVARVFNNEVFNNSCSTGGGGINLYQSSGEVAHNQLHDNAGGWGSAVYLRSSLVYVHHNVAYNHPGTLRRNAAICITYSSDSRIENNTIVNNAYGVVLDRGTVSITNNIIAYNREVGLDADSSTYTKVEFNCLWNNGSGDLGRNDYGITSDPLFVDTASDNYSLRIASPCIDRGDPHTEFLDPDGTRNDMGALPIDHILPIAYPASAGSDSMNLLVAPVFDWTYYDTALSTQQAFEIEVGTNIDPFEPNMWKTDEIYTIDTFVTYAGLPPTDGTTYYYRIRVSDGAHWGDWYYHRFRMNSEPFAPIPVYPVNETTLAGGTQLVVDVWPDRDADPLAFDFEIYEDTLAGDPAFVLDKWPSTHSKVFTGLVPGRKYFWRSRTFDYYERSAWSKFAPFIARDRNITITVPLDHTTLQAGIDAASPGDTVLALSRTYSGNRNRDIRFYGKDIILRSRAGAGETTIDCEGSASDPHRAFIIDQKEGEGLLIDGFTITNGYATGDGGALLLAGGSKVSIHSCAFRDNHADGSGGAINGAHGTLSINDCDFSGNSAARGGAIASPGVLQNSRFYANTAAEQGNALYEFAGVSGCSFFEHVGAPTTLYRTGCMFGCGNVTGCLFANNAGTCIYIYYATYSFYVSQCTFYGNERALYAGSDVGMEVVNSIITRCSSAAGQCYSCGWDCPYGGGISLDHCNVYGNRWDYADCLDNDMGVRGNINSDPLFCDPEHLDFNLADGSPCAGTGTKGQDMGAFPIGCMPTDVDEGDSSLPMTFQVSQNYPNPFNPVTIMEYTLPTRSRVTIEIFNVLGQKVRTLLDEAMPAGTHQVEWDGSDGTGQAVATGVYLYRFQAGDVVQSRKMLLLK